MTGQAEPGGISALAPAKINLSLEVIRRRPDGYHEIETIFQAVDLSDELEFAISRRGNRLNLSVEGDLPLRGGPNLVESAYELMRIRHPRQSTGLEGRLRKRIPVGGGLGGGSSDAAATLMALNRLWRLGLDPGQLEELALELGSDVPFFLRGGTAIGRGRGEKLESLGALSQGAFLLVNPGFSVSTAWAYDQLKMGLTANLYRIRVEQVKAYLSRFPVPGMVIKNRLEDVVLPAYPVFGEIIAALKRQGAVHAVLSGSGATVFGSFRDREAAEHARSELGSAWQAWVASPLPDGVRLEEDRGS